MLYTRLCRFVAHRQRRPCLRHYLTRPGALTWKTHNTHTQFRQYVRVVNYQMVLRSWNTIRMWIWSPTFPYQIAGIGGLFGLFYCAHRQSVPVSGRIRFNMVSAHWEEQMAKAMYKATLEEYGDKILPPTSVEHQTVQIVFHRLTPQSGLPDMEWDLNVIDTPEDQAWVLPGGRVFVHRGLLDLCTREDELAVVLGHEMAHNVAHHGSESLSNLLIWMAAVTIGRLVSGIDTDLVELAVDIAFRLPRSRKQEREADHLGLLIMAESGYDPSAAVDLWSRWEQKDSLERAPSYLRTHPSHHNRLDQMRVWLADARKRRLTSSCTDQDTGPQYYLQRAFCGVGSGFWRHDNPDTSFEQEAPVPSSHKAAVKQSWWHIFRRHHHAVELGA